MEIPVASTRTSSSPNGNRKHRRANASHERKATTKAAVSEKRLQDLIDHVNRLGEQIEGIRKAFNQNHSAYAQALMAVDGHVSVLRAVVNDVHMSTVTQGEDGSVDCSQYYAQYSEYIKQQQAEASNTEGKPEGNVIVSPEEFDEAVFGGDYDGNREVPEEHGSTSEENPGDEQGDSGDDDSARAEPE